MREVIGVWQIGEFYKEHIIIVLQDKFNWLLKALLYYFFPIINGTMNSIKKLTSNSTGIPINS